MYFFYIAELGMEKEYRRYLITNFLQGSLGREQEMELLQWIREDEQNKTLFLHEQRFIEAGLGGKASRGNLGAWNEFKRKIQPKKPGLARRLYRSSFMRIAAAFVLGLFVASAIVSLIFSERETSSSLQHITTPYGARTNFQLPDGSNVWLNAGSTLSFPSKFEKNRTVELTGEAFFEVKKGTPFIVSTNLGKIEVKGTSFNVKSYENEIFETTLETGVIQFMASDSSDKIVLKPGDQLSSDGKNISLTVVETEFFTSWKDGKLIFRDESLPVIAKSLERWYNIRIELDDDPDLSKILFTGSIEMESFTEVMDLIKITSAIDYSYNESTRTIHVTKQ